MKKLSIIVLISISIIGQLFAQFPDELVDEARKAINAFNISSADSAYKAAMAKAVDEDERKGIVAEWEMLEKINIMLADARRSMDRAEYVESLKKYSSAIAQMDASPHDIWSKVKAEAYYSMGMVNYRQEAPIEAADGFRSAMSFNTEEEKYGKAMEMVRNKHYSEGHKYLKRKDYPSAQAQYEISVAVDPSFASGYYQLAYIAKKDGDLNLAEKYYRDAVTSDPTHYKSWYGLGNLYSGMGNNKKAIEALKKSISINATYKQSYYVLGKVYESQKNNTLAIQNLKQAIEIDSGYTKAYELLGKIYVEKEHFKSAISLLNSVAAKNASGKTYSLLAQANNASGNFSVALTAANKSLAKKKNRNAAAYFEKGDALAGLKRNKEAIAAFKIAAKDARYKSLAEHRINEIMNK